MSDVYTNIVRGILRTTKVAHVNLPDLDLEEAAFAQYTGDPATELRQRLNAYSDDSHTDALGRLALALTPREVFAVCLASRTQRYTFEDAVRVALRHGMLPNDDTIFDVVADAETDWQTKAIEQVVRGRDATVTRARVWQFAREHDLPVGWAMRLLIDSHGGLDDALVDEIADALDRYLGTSLERASSLAKVFVHTEGIHRFIVTAEQTARLVDRGRLADLLFAAAFGHITFELREAVLARRGGLVILAGDPRICPAGRKALVAAVGTFCEELEFLQSAAANWLLEHVRIDDVEDVLAVVTAQGNHIAWLAGAFGMNRPTVDSVREALARGMVTARDVVDRSQFAPVYTSNWLAPIARETAGIVPALLDALAATGTGHGVGLDDTARGLAVILNAIAPALADDERLWRRFLTAAAGSPFRNKDLTVDEAVKVYRDRWAAAESRALSRR